MPIGSNIRLSELQALMIFSVVNYYKDIILNKNEIAEKYIESCKRNEIQFINQNQNLNVGNYYKFTIISPSNEITKVYPNIKTTTSKVYDYALGKNKEIPLKHLCLPIWYNQDKFLTDKVLVELNR